MKQAPDIRFIGMEPSEALASEATDRASKLDRFYPAIMACRITLELAHKHRQQGRSFEARVDVTLPGHQLTVSRVEHEDAYLALREAFDDMKRQIDDRMSRIRDQARQPPDQAGAEGAGSPE